MLGLTQGDLGEAIGLTLQQVQHYERGTNRIVASRLHELGCVLDVPIMFFFDDIDPVRAPAIPESLTELELSPANADPLLHDETIDLVAAFHGVADPELRRCLINLVKKLESKSNEGSPRRRRGKVGSSRRRAT
jgi:transcriptional regulator with XRE-family HTH domain